MWEVVAVLGEGGKLPFRVFWVEEVVAGLRGAVAVGFVGHGCAAAGLMMVSQVMGDKLGTYRSVRQIRCVAAKIAKNSP